jgi:superfamily II DNA or RNA helicase
VRRRFNRRERVALYLAADGRCELCGAELEPGWHADHRTAYSAGGPTDVINGQATCSTCNQKKGDRVAEPMRQWQQRAMDEYLASGARDFLLEATPGAGKTRLALAIARRLLDDRTVRQVAVVVPSDALRLQWSDVAGPLRLRPLDDGVAYKAGYDGVVITYAQLARGTSADLIRRASSTPTFGVFDELHHAGRDRSWSDGLERAFEHATRRLAMTGTPWRADNRPIPFVHYGPNDFVEPDYHYRYGAAVNDQVCRPILFHAYNGQARWVDCGKVVEADVGEDLDDDKVGAALDTLYDPKQEWIPGMLARATAALDAMRRGGVPDAAGLVWAEGQWQAKAYAQVLQQITGSEPVLVISEDADAKTKLDAFRTGTAPWLVAVRMVSEGIDIPRLSVGVYAAKARTPLFFRQCVGRLVRLRGNEEHNAEMFIPAVPAIIRHAFEIERELLHALAETEEQTERDQKDADRQQQTFDLRVPLSASEPLFDRAIHRGMDFEQPDYSEGEAACDRYGIPRNLAANVAAMLRDRQTTDVTAQVTLRPAPSPAPKHRLERQLRQEVDKLTRRLDACEGWDPGATNTKLRRIGFPARKTCSIEQLQEIRAYLAERLDQ